MRLSAFLAVICVVYGCGPRDAAVREVQTRRLMGVPWTITAYAPSKAAAEVAVEAAFAEVSRLEGILSDYAPSSELSRLSAASPTTVRADDDLWAVLGASVWFREASGGAFDPTIGPLTTLWRQARRTGRLPDPAKLAAARAAVGPSTLRLDAAEHAVELRVPGMRLDLGGIGMGYAVDRAMGILKRHGIDAAMIDASGDIAVSGPPPGKKAWRIGIARLDTPSDLRGATARNRWVELAHAAITTSGDAFQAVDIGGVRYGHIVDPRTGMGVIGPAAVTVIAADCTTADAAATAASVMGPSQGGPWIEGIPRASGLFQWVEDGEVIEATTTGWPGPPPENALHQTPQPSRTQFLGQEP